METPQRQAIKALQEAFAQLEALAKDNYLKVDLTLDQQWEDNEIDAQVYQAAKRFIKVKKAGTILT
jgi:hypothetical protein